jgi:hypothetical protein
LGWLATAWLEALAVHGPGDVQGEPVRHGDEYTAFIVDCYAVGEDGRRLYDSAFLSRPKGCDKSGLLARLALFEALGPCRTLAPDPHDPDSEPVFAVGGEVYRDPWGLGFEYVYEPGEPMGRPVRVPFIRCLATEEGQTGNVYDSVHFNLTEGPLAGAMSRKDDAGLTRVLLPGGGEIVPSTASSSAKDGGKETFVGFDEALALDTPLPTPTGWMTMGDVQVGDELIGSDGRPVRVAKTTDVMIDRDCWRVTYSDGTSVVASDGHLWQTRVRGSGAKPTVRTTGTMARDGRIFRTPAVAPTLTQRAELPIDPYILGLWLGDGDARNATVTASAADAQVLECLIVDRGYTARRCKTGEGRAELLYLSLPGAVRGRFSAVKGLKTRLREADLLRNKHIPAEYLRASFDQRLDLLRGLMDTDGHVTPDGYCTFTQTSRPVVDGVLELLRSLGQRPGVRFAPDERSRQGGVWVVTFTPVGIVPFALPRKVERVQTRTPGMREAWETIVAIEPVERVPVRCVGVEADDHLFVAGDGWHVTHNTHLYVRPELRGMYAVVTRNLRKRKRLAETWYLETTTMYRPGEESTAEETYKLAELIAEGQSGGRAKVKRERLLLDHRWGEIDLADLADEKLLAAALTEAYGDALAWNHLPGLIDEVLEPRADVADSVRYFLNDRTSAENSWLAHYEWSAVGPKPDDPGSFKVVADRDVVTLGFDGSRKRARGVTDATALIGCRVSDGHVFELGVWEQPRGAAGKDWAAPVGEVLAAVDEAFSRYTVVGFYADPAKWESHVAGWEARYGRQLRVRSSREHPVEWWMTGGRASYTVRALEKFQSAVIDGELSHDGSSALTRHVLAARMVHTRSGIQIAKEHPASERKVDAAVAAVLAYQARLDALAAGLGATPVRRVPRRIR